MAGHRKSLNPFKPGAGHSPPYLAGRESEKEYFVKLLGQDVVTTNLILTGLRGVGKTVLLDGEYKPLAIENDWVWVGSEFSEAAFVDEASVCHKLLTDLSFFLSKLSVAIPSHQFGFNAPTEERVNLNYDVLLDYFEHVPGLNADKLKHTLEFCWAAVEESGKRGVLFAYDEAQLAHDQKEKEQYPLALLLETFQSLQRKGIRYLLCLTGLPTLYPRLVESRTYAERMFHVQEIGRISPEASRQAIANPLKTNPIKLTEESVDLIVKTSDCYPYFIQYFAKEAYDYFETWHVEKPKARPVPLSMTSLIQKLDSDFYSGRWSHATDRQRDLLLVIAHIETDTGEYSVNEIATVSRRVAASHGIKPFKTGDISQMLPKLIDAGLIYKNRYGKYSFAVPLMDLYIKRQFTKKEKRPTLFDTLS